MEGGGGVAEAECGPRRCFRAWQFTLTRSSHCWCSFEISGSAFPPAQSCGVCARGHLGWLRPELPPQPCKPLPVSDPFFFFLLFLGQRWGSVAVRGLSRCREWGPPARPCDARLLTVRTSLVAKSRARGLSSRGKRAELLRSTWSLPGPGIGPVSSAFACGLLTTGPPGKSSRLTLRTGFRGLSASP